MFKRCSKIGFEILAIIIVTLSVICFGVLFKISSSPIESETLTKKLVPELNSLVEGITLDFDTTVLSFSRKDRLLTLTIRNLDISNEDGAEISTIHDVILQYGLSNILRMSSIPHSVVINQPQISFQRNQDGRFEIHHMDLSEGEKETSKLNTSNSSEKLYDALKSLLGFRSGLLERVVISDAVIFYQDFMRDVSLSAPSVSFDLSKTSDGLTGFITATVDFGNESKTLVSDFSYNPAHGGISFSTAIENFQISSAAGFIPEQFSRFIKDWTVPFNGYFSFDLNQYLQLTDLSLNVYGQSGGNISLPSIYDDPLALDAIDIQAGYNPETGDVDIEHLFINSGDMTAELAGRIYARENSDIILESQIALYDLDMGDLSTYWSADWAPKAQAWVIENITSGLVNTGQLDLKLSLPLEDILTEETENLELESFSGTLGFSNLYVDYFNPLPPAENIDGFVRFDDDNFIIFAENGVIQEHDIQLRDSVVHIRGLSYPIDDYQILSTDLNASVQLSDALRIADSEPLELLSERDISPEEYTGEGDVNLKLGFPLSKDLLLEDIKIDINGQLNKLLITDYFAGLNITSNMIDIDITDQDMSIEGAIKIAETGPFGLSWSENFYPENPSDMVKNMTIQGTVMGEDISLATLPSYLNTTRFKGPLRIKAESITYENETEDISVGIDYLDTDISIPVIAYEKASGLDSVLRFGAHKNTSGINIKELSYSSDLLKFDITGQLDGQFMPQDISINQFLSLKTDITGSIKSPKDGQYNVTLNGPSLEFSRGYEQLKDSFSKSSDDNAETAISWSLNADIGRVFLDDKNSFKEFKSRIIRSPDGFEQFHIDSHLTETETISIHYGAIMEGEIETEDRALKVKIDNLGNTLKALNITDDVIDGDLVMNLRSPQWDGTQLEGQMTVTDFRLIEAPLLARLINALTPTGILELLSTKGLEFQRMSTLVNVDQSVYKLKKGQLVGNSMGLSFDGSIAPQDDNIDISGTVIPVQGLNKMVGSIPIIGQILAGPDNKGVFGATYQIKGSVDNATVTVNPLSVIAPGILRTLLFEGG